MSRRSQSLARPWWRDGTLLWAVVVTLLSVLASFGYKDGKLGIGLTVLAVILFAMVVSASWAARSFADQEDRLLEEDGRCVEGTILDVDFVETEWAAGSYSLRYGFQTGEPGDDRTRKGVFEADPEYLLAQGLDPRPGMLMGRRVRIRYLPRSPWIFRFEGFVDDLADPCAESRKRAD